MTPVLVVMATHNSSKYVERALRSIDTALTGRPFALVIVDDGSTDDTLKRVRAYQGTCRERLVLGMSKAATVTAAKNRAVRVAMPLMDRYPWVALMDDDDEMLPGRFTGLLESMEAEGQKLGLGDWIWDRSRHSYHTHLPEAEKVQLVWGDCRMPKKEFGTWATIIHRDLIIARDGYWFPAVPKDVVDDLPAHVTADLEGHPWCYHRGALTHHYHHRSDSFCGGETARPIWEGTEKYIQRIPSTNTNIFSLCTVAIGPAAAEAALFIRSARISGNKQPILVAADPEGRQLLQGVDPLNATEFLPVDLAERRAKYPYRGPYDFDVAAISYKLDVLAEAARRHTSTMFFDADMVLLRTLKDRFTKPFAVAPAIPRSGTPVPWGTTPGLERFGLYSAGNLYLHKEALHVVALWRQDCEAAWAVPFGQYRLHGAFVEQSSLDVLALSTPIQTLHPGHNVASPRFDPGYKWQIDTHPFEAANSRITTGTGMYFRGWPVVSLHSHFLRPNWYEWMRPFFLHLMRSCTDPVTREVLRVVESAAK